MHTNASGSRGFGRVGAAPSLMLSQRHTEKKKEGKKRTKKGKKDKKQGIGCGMWTIYLFQQRDRVPAVLQAGGEAGGGRGVVILCGLGDELRHGDLVRHDPAPPVKPRRSRAHRSGERGSQVSRGKVGGKNRKTKKKKAEGRRC